MPLSVHGLANPPEWSKFAFRADEPFAKRGDGMFLDTIRPKDVPLPPPLYVRDDSLSLRTHDIEGCRPALRHKDFYASGPPEKEVVPGSLSKSHWPTLNRPIDLSLTTRDIDYAQPHSKGFRTNRSVNPLTPRYILPSAREDAITPPPVRMHEGEMRDTLTFTGERDPRPTRNYTRDPNEHRDIEGARPRPRFRQGSTPRDIFKTVEKAGERILSSKCVTPRPTCPMDPVYNLTTRTTHPFRQGDVDGATPRVIGPVEGATARKSARDRGEPQASLITGDIPGARPQLYKGTLPFSIRDPPEITPYSQGLLDVSDIDGAQTGTRPLALRGRP